jgi:hypothetical protein
VPPPQVQQHAIGALGHASVRALTGWLFAPRKLDNQRHFKKGLCSGLSLHD